jgi:hypothetical protein
LRIYNYSSRRLSTTGWGGSSGKFSIGLALLALIIGSSIFFLAQTPKSRLNVIQIVSSLLFLVIIVRYGLADRSTQPERPGAWCARYELLLAPIICAAIYATTLSSDFISDDFVHLFKARRPLLETLWSLLTRGQDGLFLRPIGFASLFLDYHLWHNWPLGYHLVNLILHLIGVIGIYFLCKGLGLDLETSATASLIFAVLPIHPESVVWIAARFDMLATPLSIWSLVLYIKYRKSGHFLIYFGAIVLFFLALLSKESAYALPLILIPLEFLAMPARRIKPLFGQSFWQASWPTLGFIALTVIVFCYRLAVLRGIGGYQDTRGQSAVFRISLGTFEGIFVRAPAQLLLGFNWLQPRAAVPVILASLTGALLLMVAFVVRPKTSNQGGQRMVWFSLSWMVLALLPAHFMLLIDASLTNSRVLYLSSVGAAIFLALLLAGIDNARIREGSKLFLVVLFSIGLFHNLRAWQWTSEQSQNFLIELKRLEPSPPPGAEFAFRGLPGTIRGVFFFHAGLTEAINLTFDRQDLIGSRDSDAATGRPTIKLNWIGGKDGKEPMIERDEE